VSGRAQGWWCACRSPSGRDGWCPPGYLATLWCRSWRCEDARVPSRSGRCDAAPSTPRAGSPVGIARWRRPESSTVRRIRSSWRGRLSRSTSCRARRCGAWMRGWPGTSHRGDGAPSSASRSRRRAPLPIGWRSVVARPTRRREAGHSARPYVGRPELSHSPCRRRPQSATARQIIAANEETVAERPTLDVPTVGGRCPTGVWGRAGRGDGGPRGSPSGA